MASLHWADYIIFIIFMLASLAIGVYHSLAGGRQKTTQEFIVANRHLKVLPTVLSLVASNQSAIIILGSTAEMYNWGYAAWPLGSAAIILSLIITERLFVPWLFPLKLTSVYEYLLMRYKSKAVSMIGSFLGIASGVMYMGTAIYAPSIALEAACGLPVVVSIPVMAVLATIYTALGGMKAVIWTDVLQLCIMLIGMLTVLIKATVEVGGIGEAVKYASEHGRLDPPRFGPDFTVRHTVLGFLLGQTIAWAGYNGTSQAAVQRFSATKTQRQSRLTVLLQIPVVLLVQLFAPMTGLMVFGYFAKQKCDPLTSGYVSSGNQILPHFVSLTFANAKGFNGLFLSTLYSGALSSVSSSLSGCAANTWQSIIVPIKSDFSEATATLINRCLVVFFGGVATCVAFLAATMPGPVTQMSLTFGGAVGGPLIGLFLLAGCFAFSEWKGALIGTLTALCCNLVVGTGARLLPPANIPLPPVSTEGCIFSLNSTEAKVIESFNRTRDSEIFEPQGFDALLSLSYLWYPVLGAIVCMAVGCIISISMKKVMKEPQESVPKKYLIQWRDVLTFQDRPIPKNDDGIIDTKQVIKRGVSEDKEAEHALMSENGTFVKGTSV